jgi:hypothetical protein
MPTGPAVGSPASGYRRRMEIRSARRALPTFLAVVDLAAAGCGGEDPVEPAQTLPEESTLDDTRPDPTTTPAPEPGDRELEEGEQEGEGGG